jgi:hypothetical protein
MKKVILFLSVIALASCHAVSEGPLPTNDSTFVTIDSIDSLCVVSDTVIIDSLQK